MITSVFNVKNRIKNDDPYSEPLWKSQVNQKYDLCTSTYIFLKSFVTLVYGFHNNLLAGQSFNENLLYLSPVLKKVYFY
jgi:hypothetical protein